MQLRSNQSRSYVHLFARPQTPVCPCKEFDAYLLGEIWLAALVCMRAACRRLHTFSHIGRRRLAWHMCHGWRVPYMANRLLGGRIHYRALRWYRRLEFSFDRYSSRWASERLTYICQPQPLQYAESLSISLVRPHTMYSTLSPKSPK